MKTHILVVACSLPLLCLAETADPAKERREPEKEARKIDAVMDRVPDELKERFSAAREEAMKSPRVAELRAKMDAASKELRAVVREEMQKVDPGLQESLRGILKTQKKEKGGERRVWNLPAGGKEKLEAARSKAQSTPAVKAAAAAMKSAKTPEERDVARAGFQEAMRAAVLQIDPSLEEMLDKMRPPKKGAPEKNQAVEGMSEMGEMSGMSE